MALAAKWQDNGEEDYLCPIARPLMRPDEAAEILGRSVNFIYGEVESGHLEAYKPKGRDVNRYMITTRSVKLYLAESATVPPQHFMERVLALVAVMTAPQLDALIAAATTRRRRNFVA